MSSIIIKSEKGKSKEFENVYSKCLPSRQMWSNTVYYFPNANFNQVRLGEPEECLFHKDEPVEMSDKFIV